MRNFTVQSVRWFAYITIPIATIFAIINFASTAVIADDPEAIASARSQEIVSLILYILSISAILFLHPKEKLQLPLETPSQSGRVQHKKRFAYDLIKVLSLIALGFLIFGFFGLLFSGIA